MYTVRTLLKKAVNILRESMCPTPLLDGEIILCHVLDKSRLWIAINGDAPVSDDLASFYLKYIEERKCGRPVAYITKRQEFMGLELFIDDGVLIPRPDTETLVNSAIEKLSGISNPRFIDMCTGSGAIAVSLSYYIKDAFFVAVDIDDNAIRCSSINIDKFNLKDRVIIKKGDLFSPIMDKSFFGCFDAVVSNPPYIPHDEIPYLMGSVKDYESHRALDGGKDGLDFYRVIAKESPLFLKKGGFLLVEIGYNQAEDVISIFEETKYYDNIEIKRDLAGLSRCIYANYIGSYGG